MPPPSSPRISLSQTAALTTSFCPRTFLTTPLWLQLQTATSVVYLSRTPSFHQATRSGSALTPPLHLTFYGLLLQGSGDEELPRRAAIRTSLRLSQVVAGLPLGSTLGRAGCLAVAPGPTHGTGAEPRLFLLRLLPVARRPSGPFSSPVPVATLGLHKPRHVWHGTGASGYYRPP